MIKAVLVMLCAGLLSIACGGSSAPGGSQAHAAPTAATARRAPEGTGAAGSVCYLVPDAEIERIMGRPPITTSGFELGGERFCTWIVYMDPVENAGLVLSRAENFDEQVGIWSSREAVSGLGQAAYWIPDVGGLYVKAGAYTLYFSVDSEATDVKTAAISIAREAISRLP